jgi:hypothetical protein
MSPESSAVENETTVRRKAAVVLRARDERSDRGTLLMHVDEQEGRLVPGGLILAVPVYPGQAGLAAALFGVTRGFTCTQTIRLGAVMLSLSPALFQVVSAALREFVGDFEMQGVKASPNAD